MMLTEPSFMFSFSYPNGEPQTPTRTPPTTVFGDGAFQTPKLESSFYDPRVTWDTSDPYASSPEFLRTPQRFGLNTPSNPLRLPDTAPDRNAITGSANLRSARASDQTDTARRIRPSKPYGDLGEEGLRTVDSAKSAASMQTPPPSSASRRKVTGLDNVNDTARRISSPGAGGHLETPSRLMGASPQLFGNLPSSPDLFQLASADPTASPFFPQQKLFWDQDPEQHGNNLSMSGGNMNLFDSSTADVFGTHHNPMPDPHIPQLPSIEGTLDLPEFNNNGFGLSSAGPADTALFPAPFSTSPRIPVPKAEDPALFLSSPARRFGGIQPSPNKRLFSRPTRQPYHHQTEESKREEIRRSQCVNQHLPAFDDDDEDDLTPRRLRPGLTRSLTQSAIGSSHRPLPLQPSSGMMASATGIRKSPSKGRSSPVKSLRPSLSRANSVATGLPTRSQSVVLKIGKDGRAKAEMQSVPEPSTGLTDPISAVDLEDSTAADSEYDSAAEFSEYPTIPSRHPSMVFSEAGRPMLARSDSGSRPVSKGSYTSIASSHSGRASPWAGSSRSRRPQYSTTEDWRRTPTRHSSMVVNSDFSHGSARSVSAAALPDPEEDTGDAQHALRQVLRQRSRRQPHTIGYGPRFNHPSRSLAHLRSSPPRFGAELDIKSREPNTSPTTMTDPDLATPATERYSNPSNGTRCVCNSMDNGGHLMIQCESCNHWLHTKCVGLERSHLPSFYICMFCAQTPTRRQRARPMGGASHAPTSPLAHKSYRFR
ncbi:hypothetical protein ASPWEDRAFT_171600 [Aspergillus wentii DTO 134E9]|uniref:PHD-type domain-containing protein n=1 Tax=Aspergillus wentii DTO 134E9 TaxID=1073089 RepID=A0A1L9RIL9_ASPWE|nr:uncharacterized protein ASPWEDRAFT_171600 [Aspergillus wentii DTO 134E9]KAI9932274.1 hypothetical protein MW887_009785 [Aspergillus wentii]OJJ34765.1 hypothetical protein ASPWEDRAFT_171600 [Aspergillus wentii DTO 134E9]